MYVCMYVKDNIYIYIYVYGTPSPIDLPFSCVWEPHHTKMVDPWTITILWLRELHPGPIEFNRGRLSSIEGRIED